MTGVPGDGPGTGAAAGADKWAKAVVDGLRSEGTATGPESADSAAPDDSWVVDAELVDDEAVEAEPPEVDVIDDKSDGGETAEADIDPDAEIIDAELVDAETAEPAEVVEDAEVSGVQGSDDADANVAGATAPPAAADEENPASDISVEDLVLDLERVTTERDQYLDASRRLQAEFENYKKQVAKREAEARERANDSLIGELLPVLDAFDGAVANGAEDVVPMRSSFLDAMAKQGLERIDPGDGPFDPTLHEAVMHEDASDVDGPVVAEVMRAGYVWKGRVLRPAMVRTRG